MNSRQNIDFYHSLYLRQITLGSFRFGHLMKPFNIQIFSNDILKAQHSVHNVNIELNYYKAKIGLEVCSRKLKYHDSNQKHQSSLSEVENMESLSKIYFRIIIFFWLLLIKQDFPPEQKYHNCTYLTLVCTSML